MPTDKEARHIFLTNFREQLRTDPFYTALQQRLRLFACAFHSCESLNILWFLRPVRSSIVPRKGRFISQDFVTIKALTSLLDSFISFGASGVLISGPQNSRGFYTQCKSERLLQAIEDAKR